MSDFDDGFAMSDTEAFAAMGEAVHLWMGEQGFDTVAIVRPGGSLGSVQRVGGPAQRISLEAELTGEDVKNHGVTDGWKIRWKDLDFRINSLTPQGETFLAICNGRGDAQDE